VVAAIVIPIICLYFYFLTKKEMKAQDQKWLAMGQIPEEAVLYGEIKEIMAEKQRFYYNRFIYVQEIKLQTESKCTTVKHVTPLVKNARLQTFQTGEMIRVYGRWQGHEFFFNRLEILHNQ
jgi:hypothetical protein